MKSLTKNKNYMLAMISSSLAISVTYSFPTLMAEILFPYDYTNDDMSLYGALYNGVGICGGIIVSIVLTRYPYFKRMQLFIYAFSIITAVGIFISATQATYAGNGYTLTLCLITLNGFFSISVFSTCYEYVVELSPGIGESISGGLINMVAYVLGFVEINIVQMFDKLDSNIKHRIHYAFFVILACLGFATVILLFV